MSGSGRGSRGTCPGSHTCDQGSLTIEAAAGVVFLTVSTVLLSSGLVIGASALGLASHARDAARVAALQSDRAGAERAVHGLFDPSTTADISSDGTFVTVELTRRVDIGRITGFTLSASATAVEEMPW